jgi:hypothetical protein
VITALLPHQFCLIYIFLDSLDPDNRVEEADGPLPCIRLGEENYEDQPDSSRPRAAAGQEPTEKPSQSLKRSFRKS